MPASIILSNLSLSSPDGRSLFSNIDLTFGAERTGLVGRNGVGKTTLLASISREHIPPSGRVAINGTVGLLRQNVQPLSGAKGVDPVGARGALLRRVGARTARVCVLRPAAARAGGGGGVCGGFVGAGPRLSSPPPRLGR